MAAAAALAGGSSKGLLEKMRRFIWTIYFMLAMLASLLVASSSLLVAILDILVPCFLTSSFTCICCYSFKDHLHRYAFTTSFTDIPLLSLIRSLIITCVYSLYDGPALSHGPYLGIVTLCSFISILLLSVKACFFSLNSQLEPDHPSYSLATQNLHFKKSWGMPILFLSSVVFALGHIVIAYRISCKAQRKFFFHRSLDTGDVLPCKITFSSFQKIPRSPTPAGKTPKGDCEARQKSSPIITSHEEKEFPVRFLADVDSLFISCDGLTVHYKLSMPCSPSRSLSSTTFLNAPALNVAPRTHYPLHRSSSNKFHTSSLYAPLLVGNPSPRLSDEIIPVLSLDDGGGREEEMCALKLSSFEYDLEANDQTGIVLVHGFGGGVFSWRHVMGPLALQLGHTVAAFDRPGWGLTSRPRRKDWEESHMRNPYKFESQVDLLLSFCSKVGFKSVILIGHDDGGLLALKAAQKIHESLDKTQVNIKGVVLLNVSLSREVVPAFARILLHTSLGKKHMVRPLLRTEITQVVNRHAWYDSGKLTRDILRLYKAPLCVEGWDEALHEIGKLSSETVLAPQNISSLLESIKDLPVLVIAGVEDVLVPLRTVQAMAFNLENSKLVAISGCGHLPHEECPKALLAAITPFITRVLLDPGIQNQ
ncbi:uncharacterized protein LOC124936780 [Impatiens glandulifera]|uniref:uncharacterized protein LOC124936780 n=1 Tax=Impatiens glandulifera TaxID=253017 RepID=UPI001FB098E8|nr:uncharacterized protein LOC124936780 [Impatiens glandulifera]